MTQLRLGAIGLGRAFSAIAASLRAHPGVRLVVAADPRSEARARCEAEFGSRTVESAEAIYADPEVEAVYIATPLEMHADQTVAALKAGKHVVVEKPMAMNIADALRMIEASKRYGRRLLVGHIHSFDPPILRARDLIESGKYGKPRMISAWRYTDYLYRPRRPEELDTAQGGGAIFNQALHQVEIVRLLGGGDIASVRGRCGAWDRARPTEGAYSAMMNFANGAFATITYSGYGHYDTDALLGWIGEGGAPRKPDEHGGSRRALRKIGSPEAEAAAKALTGYGGPNQRESGPQVVGVNGQRHEHFGVVIVSCDGADLWPSPAGVTIYEEGGRQHLDVPAGSGGGPRAGVFDELCAAVRGEPVVHDGEWSVGTLEASLAILESSNANREVPLQHQSPPGDRRASAGR